MRKIWTPEERNYMLAHYSHLPTSRIAEELGRTERSVYSQAIIMKLKKSKQFLQSIYSGRLQPGNNILGSNTQFRRGHNTWNKGKKMPKDYCDDKPKMKATQFKKGQQPHNTLYDGVIVMRKEKTGRLIKLIRIAKAKWQYLSVYTWEQHYGPVPEGMIVAFKDRNSMNCVIENLELIDRAENMRRNTIHRYPEELKKTIRTLGKLKRKIKSHEKQD